ncbi:leucine-rich repeat-containing protein 28-like isoform X3 [Haliotis rubra]|uniref:leucine-rich repeat-containing protein 28-like isoform X3 n=1 Tax=Haliotis rubra TaxID=36100 RepID=UPI001EE5E1B1|nr:leucine-rich repeat-containing protein 28-like isoform X3 [Haliotis rubra]
MTSDTPTTECNANKRDKILQLNYKGLQQLPTVLTETEDFKHITNLYLKRNCLTTLPERIDMLQNLVVLYLHSNKLTALPNTIGDLSNLECLDVGSNCLTFLPESIGRLAKLTSLKLAYNMVTHMPKSVGNLHHLVSLEAMNNRLRSLPLELFDCRNLEVLSVDSNQLHSIPRQICKLTRLKEMSATGNNIIMLPQDMGTSENLKSIFVDCNCYLTVLPIDLLKRQVGFYRCGSLPLSKLSDAILSNICCVTVKHTETCSKALPLPWEIRKMSVTWRKFPDVRAAAVNADCQVLQVSVLSVHYGFPHGVSVPASGNQCLPSCSVLFCSVSSPVYVHGQSPSCVPYTGESGSRCCHYLIITQGSTLSSVSKVSP